MSEPNNTSCAPVSPPPRVLAGWKRALAGLAGALVRLWVATLRFRPDPGVPEAMADETGATLFVLWHNRLFVAAELSRRYRPTRPLHALVSASKDGAWLTAFFSSVGLRAVRGSSSKGGREAVTGLVDVLKAGNDAGITPDGPRGPVYVCKPGALVVARRARARVLLMGIHYSDAWRVRSWDRLMLPRPFSTVAIRVRVFSAEELEGSDALARLEAALRAMNPEPAPSSPLAAH